MTKARLLEIAAAELGYREGDNNDSKYGRWYGMNKQPWCMMFISWCAAQAKISESVIPKLAYVPYAVEHFRRTGRYYAVGELIPRPGDLVFFGSSSHVGLVESCTGSELISIEGNTSSGGNNSNGEGVYRRRRRISDGWIMGYARPAYEEDDMAEQQIRVRLIKQAETVTLSGFVIDGATYIKLRELERLFPVQVSWDEAARLPQISPLAPAEGQAGAEGSRQ